MQQQNSTEVRWCDRARPKSDDTKTTKIVRQQMKTEDWHMKLVMEPLDGH